MKPLENKVAVITGASRGLGRAMALALAEQGASIALVARDAAALAEVSAAIQAIGGTAETYLADVTDEASVAALEAAVIARFGKVQILVNNAGMNLRKKIHEFSLEEWMRVTNTNLTSVFLLCRAFVPNMKGQGYGRIINMTSIMAHVSLPERTAYSSTKAALLGLTKSLAMELAPDNITVVGISPGPFLTEMNLAISNDAEKNAMFLSKIPVGRWGKVEEIGSLATYICSDAAGFITGTDILIDGGWCAS
jgi:NAD(P)-dependent dehydrogenase (short-subunit alcohol dehydrogenase family)